jgi:hypothetical protein
MGHRSFAIVLAVCLAVPRPAHADDRGLAVLVGNSEGDPIVLKISDELRALGFVVEVAPHDSDRARIRERAKRDDAVAVVLVDERDIEVRVVTAEQVHERHLSRGAADPSTSALAAVEVVRGYLVPVPQTPETSAPTAPEPSTARPREKAPSISVHLGGGFVSARSFPSQASATLGGAKHFGRLAIELAAVATVPGDGWCGGIDLAVRFAPLGYTRPVAFAVGVGTTGLAVAYKEDGKRYSADAAALPYAGVVVLAPIAGMVSARVDGSFGVSIPSPTFKSKTGGDVQFGSSVTAVSVGIELAW